MPAMVSLVSRQTSPSDILNGATKLATWDGCMAKSYCKWPVIIGIIIGCVFAFSLLWCLVRCACLGKDFACCCFRCLSCCCGPKRTPDEGGYKYGNLSSAPPTRNGQYQSHGKMDYGPDSFSKTATFEGNVHADSLPAMPSWETAASRKVEIVEKAPVESVEMDSLKEARSPSLREGTPSPSPMGPARSQSGYNGIPHPSSPGGRMGPSRNNSGHNGFPSPSPMAPQRNNSGHNGFPSPMAPQRNNSDHDGMPSPLEPTLPNIYGSGNRSPRGNASPVYNGGHGGMDGYNRGPASGRNTPQTPYSAGGSRDNYSSRSPGYGPPTASSYTTASNGYGPPTNSSYSTAANGYGGSGGGYIGSGGHYDSGSAGGYAKHSGYDTPSGAGYSAYDAPVQSPYGQQPSRRPGPSQQQGSWRDY